MLLEAFLCLPGTNQHIKASNERHRFELPIIGIFLAVSGALYSYLSLSLTTNTPPTRPVTVTQTTTIVHSAADDQRFSDERPGASYQKRKKSTEDVTRWVFSFTNQPEFEWLDCIKLRGNSTAPRGTCDTRMLRCQAPKSWLAYFSL
ncbi:hypothetical protein BU23DRAFT_173723 [Bimuria novae-zelandiae CBS 107.79]|uniref:Uncharacterized protein n=1 Tax=Bimuria novae-zelandiae CBS 107.79 TaxID=1447943 RepID=A0A6A5V4P7_9PLEO|nr:hypothetical protein BU23DRAFT_173723 [Bimuria novae-zelandiae CBS 107.79]